MTREEAIAELEHILPRTSAIQLAIDSINNDLTIKKVYDIGYKDGQEALAVHLELCKEEQEPCEDCISREAVQNYVESYIQEINTGYGDLNNHTNRILRMIVDGIGNMPSIQPQPKAGRWIYTGDYITDGMLKCSECGFEHDVSERFSYCPHCGCRMVEPQEKEVKE